MLTGKRTYDNIEEGKLAQKFATHYWPLKIMTRTVIHQILSLWCVRFPFFMGKYACSCAFRIYEFTISYFRIAWIDSLIQINGFYARFDLDKLFWWIISADVLWSGRVKGQFSFEHWIEAEELCINIRSILVSVLSVFCQCCISSFPDIGHHPHRIDYDGYLNTSPSSSNMV